MTNFAINDSKYILKYSNDQMNTFNKKERVHNKKEEKRELKNRIYHNKNLLHNEKQNINNKNLRRDSTSNISIEKSKPNNLQIQSTILSSRTKNQRNLEQKGIIEKVEHQLTKLLSRKWKAY